MIIISRSRDLSEACWVIEVPAQRHIGIFVSASSCQYSHVSDFLSTKSYHPTNIISRNRDVKMEHDCTSAHAHFNLRFGQVCWGQYSLLLDRKSLAASHVSARSLQIPCCTSRSTLTLNYSPRGIPLNKYKVRMLLSTNKSISASRSLLPTVSL